MTNHIMTKKGQRPIFSLNPEFVEDPFGLLLVTGHVHNAENMGQHSLKNWFMIFLLDG